MLLPLVERVRVCCISGTPSGNSKTRFRCEQLLLGVDAERVSTVSTSGLIFQGIETQIPGSSLTDGLGQANSGVDSSRMASQSFRLPTAS